MENSHSSPKTPDQPLKEQDSKDGPDASSSVLWWLSQKDLDYIRQEKVIEAGEQPKDLAHSSLADMLREHLRRVNNKDPSLFE